MWSVKTWPNPGSCSRAARSSAVRGDVDGASSMVRSLMTVTVPGRRCGVTTAGRRPPRRPRGCCAGRPPRRVRGQVGRDGSLDPGGLVGQPEVVEQQGDRQDRRGRVGHALPRDVGGAAVHRLEHRGVGAAHVEVAARREPDAPADGGGQVGDDVAEEVVGDHDVEAARVGDQEDRGGVDVQVVGRHVREVGGDGGHGAGPEVAGVGEHVGLVHEGQVPARSPLRPPERVADDPLDAVRRVDAHLGGDLVRGAAADGAAVADVRPLGALPDHDEVDVLRPAAGQRRRARPGRAGPGAG